MLLVENRVDPPLCGFPQSLGDFLWRCQVDARQLIDRHSLELNKAAHCPWTMLVQPQVNSTVEVSFFAAQFCSPLQIGLGKIPEPVLTALDRNLQKIVRFGHNQLVSGLVSSMLN